MTLMKPLFEEYSAVDGLLDTLPADPYPHDYNDHSIDTGDYFEERVIELFS